MRFFVALFLATVLIPAVFSLPNEEPLKVDADFKLRGRSLLDSASYRMASMSNDVKSLKGEIVSDPACCTAGVHLTYCFVRWRNGFVYYRRVGTGEKWKSMGRWIVGAPTCVAHGTTVTVIVSQGVVGPKPPLISASIVNGKLGGWVSTGIYNVREVPGCVAVGDEIYCANRGAKCGTDLYKYSGGQWKPWTSTPGEVYSPIAAWYTPETKEFNYYGTNAGYHMAALKVVGSSIAKWAQTGTFVMTGRASICSKGPKQIDVFTQGPGSNLLWLQRLATGAYKWRNVGGPIIYPPSCVGRPGNINCFAVNFKNELVRKVYSGGKWGPYTVLGAGYAGTPACHFSIAGVNIVSVYARTLKGTIDTYGLVA